MSSSRLRPLREDDADAVAALFVEGWGEALLRRSFGALHARGLRKVRLSVDAESPTGATRLYEHAGMRVLRQSNTREREL